MSRIKIDKRQVTRIRKRAREITRALQLYIDSHTTVTVERATLRMMGLSGVGRDGHPLVNILVDHLCDKLSHGIACFAAQAAIEFKTDLISIARQVDEGRLDLTAMKPGPNRHLKSKALSLCRPQIKRIDAQRTLRKKRTRSGKADRPFLYVIVATGNIYEDVRQASAAARTGADIIAVIRSTAQSLLDYVPYGPTTEGFGGTYATQENFAVMREALDEVGEELGRYIMLVNYASGLCMPEIAVMGALERLDMMLNDSMYGILFRDINMYRTFVDQHFSRMLSAYANIIINTGEDNYLTTADAFDRGHTVIASNFINEQFAGNAGMKPGLMGLGHAFEIDPKKKNSFLYELAQAMLIRECFPCAPIKYMPPTKHMTGNIFTGYMLNTMFNLAGIWSRQGIQLLGMLSEALHTPHLHDRFLALENARYVFSAAEGLADEISFKPGGIVQKRVNKLLDKTEQFLTGISKHGLLKAIERGSFADIKRKKTDGKGLDGVYTKDAGYYNPVEDYLKSKLGLTGGAG